MDNLPLFKQLAEQILKNLVSGESYKCPAALVTMLFGVTQNFRGAGPENLTWETTAEN